MSLSIDEYEYEYMDEDAIDDELKCIICTQPLQSPVSLACQHTFCQFCIETWIKKNASCPICRHQFETKYMLTKVINSTLCNQLDCLLIRCLRCNKTGIKRIKLKKHFQRCSKSQMMILSNMFRNRWHLTRRMIQSKYNRQAISHQTRVQRAAEIIDTNHELQNVHIRSDEQQFSNLSTRIFPETTFPRSSMLRPHEQNQNRALGTASDQKREAIFYICICILVVLLLIIFEAIINTFLQHFGKLILLVFFLWLGTKLKRAN